MLGIEVENKSAIELDARFNSNLEFADMKRTTTIEANAAVKAAHTASEPTSVRFGFILTNEFSMLAFSCFIEALRQMEDYGAHSGTSFCQWEVLGEGKPTISSCRIGIAPSASWAVASDYDYVVVIGGRQDACLPLAALDCLSRIQARGKGVVIAIDTATFVIARARMFLDRTHCIHWFHYHEFVEEFPKVASTVDSIFRVDGNYISCAGGTWTADLALYLLSAIWSPEHANRATTLMGLERMRSATHYQAPFFQGAPIVRDARVMRAIHLIERRGNSPPTLEELASVAGTSTRQLERLFVQVVGMGPQKCSRLIRLRFGHWLLENTMRSVAQIAFDCGFADQSHFARNFRAQFNLTPNQVRKVSNDGAVPVFP